MEVDTLPFGCPQTACLCGLFSHSMLLVGRANTNICYATVWTVVCLEDLQHILEIMSWAGTEGLTVSYLICDQWLLLNNNSHWLHDNRWCWLCGHGCKSDLAISGAFWAVKFSQVG